MEKNRFPLIMKSIAIITTLCTFLFILLYFRLQQGWILSCAITFGTTAYHFVMRLCVILGVRFLSKIACPIQESQTSNLFPLALFFGNEFFAPNHSKYVRCRNRAWDHYDPQLLSSFSRSFSGGLASVFIHIRTCFALWQHICYGTAL